MRLRDLVALTLGAVGSGRVRTRLTALGIAVGMAAVVLLTSLGRGLRGFVLSEFVRFGTNVISINPGQTRTSGIPGGIVGNVRPLTLADAEALRGVPHVQRVVPVVQGNVQVEAGGKTRRLTVFGCNADAPAVWRFRVSHGQFLPREEGAPRALAVLGSKARAELFGTENPLGQRIRIAGDRYTVIGVNEPKGQMLGMDLDDTVYLPVERALGLFNREGLVQIDLSFDGAVGDEHVQAAVRRLLLARHGKEDFTVMAQRQMLDTLGSVLDMLTFAVAALGGISLFVGAVGVLTVMTIAVKERVAEIGLLSALGARRGQVLLLFLGEAIVLAALGGALGLLLGLIAVVGIRIAVPDLPIDVSWQTVAVAAAVSCGIGLVAGVVPAWQAARLDPVQALRAE
jgi:putative ABC transport system permease protein